MKSVVAIISVWGLVAGAALAQSTPSSQKAQDQLARPSSPPIDESAPLRTATVQPETMVPAAQVGANIELARSGASSNETCPGAATLPVETAKALTRRIATDENFYPEFVLSITNIESRYVSTARSGKGAYGLMQLSDDTARRFNVNRCDPADNVRGGVRLLRTLHARFRNPFFILAAWSAGEQALTQHRGIPPFPKTARFIADVMNDFYDWPSLDGSAPAEQGLDGGGGRLAASDPAGRSKPPQPANPFNAAPWADGFVMHIQ